MGQKIVQLDMLKAEKESFEELTAKTFRALFASLNSRNKSQDLLIEHMGQMQDMILSMNDRLNRLAEK